MSGSTDSGHGLTKPLLVSESLRCPEVFSDRYRLILYNRSTLLGKALRVDVDNNDDGVPYSIPSDNPFMGEKEARPGKPTTPPACAELPDRDYWLYGWDE